jgi:hypothetical protein
MTERLPFWTAYRVVILNLLLAAGLLIGLAMAMWWQPILADEWDFYRAAAHWSRNHHLVPHPHAYVHLIQLSFMIFGPGLGSARLIGVLSALVSLLLIPPLVYSFYDHKERVHWVVIGAIWLYALNPMTAQNMVLLDIDNTLLTPTLLAILWIWKVAQDWSFRRRAAVFALALAIALWVKLYTPLLLMACIGMFHLFRGEIKRTGEVVLVALVGSIIFWATFTPYTILTNFKRDIFTYALGRASPTLSSMLLRFPQGMGIFVMWLSLPLTLLTVVAVGRTLVRLIKRQSRAYDLLAVYAAVTVLSYSLIIEPAWGYPRYQAPVVPVIAILVAALVIREFQSLPRCVWFIIVGLGAAAFTYKLIAIHDPLWSLYALTFETNTGDLRQRLVQGLIDTVKLAIPIGVAVIIGYLLSIRWRSKRFPLMVLTLGVLALAHTASTTAVQVTADYSTRYRYTYEYNDLLQTIADVEQIGGYILAPPGVLYYTELPGEEIYDYLGSGSSPQNLIDKLHSTRVNALVWTTKEDNRWTQVSQNPAVVQVLNACYTRVTHGVFIVYLRKNGVPCP